MPKPSTPDVWAGSKTFGFQPSSAQQAQGFDYIATLRPSTGAPITDDHDWPLNKITTGLKWVMDQLPDGGIQALLTALLPKRSFTQNDFIRIPDVPGGLIIQWGTATSNTSGLVNVTLPAAYPTAQVFQIVTVRNCNFSSNSYAMSIGPVGQQTRTGLTALSSQATTVDVNWLSMGY